MHLLRRPWLLAGIIMARLVTPLAAQVDAPSPPDSAAPVDATDTVPEPQEQTDEPHTAELWTRLIYVPFRELQKVFNRNDATAIVPYADYIELLRHYRAKPDRQPPREAVITKAVYTAAVEEEIARVSAELTITVLKQDGWARLPVSFGRSAVGSIQSNSDENTILRGTDDGQYELLLKGGGRRTVTLELLASVTTSPEARTFELECPAVGINELQVTIPERDQTVRVSPVEVLLPADGSDESQTVVKAALGTTRRIQVRWYPKAGLRPQMDLLTGVSNETTVRIEPQLIQTTSNFTWEILRGELREATILVPVDARIVDVAARTGRIQAWDRVKSGNHQQVRIELLTPVSDRLEIEVQTERVPQGDTVQLLGHADDGSLRGVHADGVVRESGRLAVATDSSLTLVTKERSGVKRISGTTPDTARQVTWEFAGSRSSLIVQLKPVEARLTARQTSQLVFGDDDLQLTTHVDFLIERAGVFDLQLKYPESLTIDSVRADGMSEFHVDKEGGIITLALTDRRQGSIGVDVRGHQSFDSGTDNLETVLPAVQPLHVERSTGLLTVLAPQFLDVVTIEEQRSGVTPVSNRTDVRVGRAQAVSSWSFAQQPWTLAVRTSPRPAQVDAVVVTTAEVDPQIVRFSSEIRFNIRNAGIDTFRIAAPEAVADDIRFRSVIPRHVIQQRNRAPTAEDGWVNWTLVLQSEVTGAVRIAADWELTLADTDDRETRTFVAEPLRVLAPFSEGSDQKRRVTLTQTRGEMRLLRHESLSITAEGSGATTEAIDIRELEYLPTTGDLAFRYFTQPVSATVEVREHDVHEVVATVVSRAAIEIVTEKQPLASYRCRYRVTTSERQRLRIEVPAGSELQAPTLNNRRTTFEPADDVTVEANWQAFYINVSRSGTSDRSFLLSFQLRCPIVEAGRFPYEGRAGRQLIRIPRIGHSSGGTVIQATRVGVWTPKDVTVFGEPEYWTVPGRRLWSFLRLPGLRHDRSAASSLDRWIGDENSVSAFEHHGNATVFRSPGSTSVLQVRWWNHPFMVAVVSGALVLIGLVLRNTTWENRITLILLATVGITLWGLFDAKTAGQFVSAGFIGLVAVAAIWFTGLLLGQRPNIASVRPPDSDGDLSDRREETTPPAPPSKRESPEFAAELPPGTVTPAPGVKELMSRLMGSRNT